MAKNENEFTKSLRYYGISKRQLGQELKISQPTIKDYCSNPSKFRLDQLRAIGKLTNLDLNEVGALIGVDGKE